MISPWHASFKSGHVSSPLADASFHVAYSCRVFDSWHWNSSDAFLSLISWKALVYTLDHSISHSTLTKLIEAMRILLPTRIPGLFQKNQLSISPTLLGCHLEQSSLHFRKDLRATFCWVGDLAYPCSCSLEEVANLPPIMSPNTPLPQFLCATEPIGSDWFDFLDLWLTVMPGWRLSPTYYNRSLDH